MAYNFRIAHLFTRKVDSVMTGLVIGVTCENLDNAATSELTWFAPRIDFPAWPPTKQQVKDYIEPYLEAKPTSSDTTRAADMKAKAVVVTDDPDDSWSESEKELEVNGL